MTGSVAPSSRFLIHRMLSKVDWTSAELVLEYGPGVGIFTIEILRRMRSDARLVAIEMNLEFVQFVEHWVRDPRLAVVLGSAGDADKILAANQLPPADYIISSLPYAAMPVPVREAIVRKAREVLRPGGALISYHYSKGMIRTLQSVYGSVDIDFEPINIPPAWVCCCRKSSS